MPSLRDHAAARRAQSALSQVETDTFKQAIARTFETIRQEVWPNGQPPNDDEYVAVVVDRLERHGRLTPEEYTRFCLLSRAVKTALAMAAVADDGGEDEEEDE